MGLHNFIRISNFPDEDFSERMGHTENSNTDGATDQDDMEAAEVEDGDVMANIKEYIANKLWQDKNTG
ncbi:hypothetical protein ARALYDRAFT_489764 [Arabidopsis lyrata subsp. lyrata]|uniref:Uncharacterized protein n=1 Tax=Arabidopsis lyrata subsp. lyrata TaxID=81972 RepID=D7M8G9_ARALL|nr:hypothetical protein ARALYDRAFT_489764 [Arabidopsis lyrata subsp. lyrata]